MVTICRFGLIASERTTISDSALALWLLDTVIALGAVLTNLQRASQVELAAAAASAAARDTGGIGRWPMALERRATELHLVVTTTDRLNCSVRPASAVYRALIPRGRSLA